MKKQEKGITLIALVITIIVLLILAGVTIALLTSDSSAPQKAKVAAENDAVAATKDDFAMTVNEILLKYYHATNVPGSNETINSTNLVSTLNTELAKVQGSHTGKNGITVTYTDINGSTDGVFTIQKSDNTKEAAKVNKDGKITTWKAVS